MSISPGDPEPPYQCVCETGKKPKPKVFVWSCCVEMIYRSVCVYCIMNDSVLVDPVDIKS